MAESILFNTVEKILDKVTSLAVEECCLAWGLESDLKKLETSLSIINAVILDAEEKQSNNNRITIWLRLLKRVLYDAEDVLDEFAYEILRKNVVNTHGDFKRKVCHFFSSSNPIAYRLRICHKIKDIRMRLDEIAAEACFTKFKQLKFLVLEYSKFEELPKSIGTLKHLRYLNVTNCSRLKKLPDSICKLHYLQTMILNGCTELEELPERLGELNKSQIVDIDHKTKATAQEWNWMPHLS